MARVRPRPGAYDHYVTLAHWPKTADEPPEDLDPAGEWCSFQPVSGDLENRTTQFIVEMRYRPDVTVDTRMTYFDRQLFVRVVINVDEAFSVLRLQCEEVAT